MLIFRRKILWFVAQEFYKNSLLFLYENIASGLQTLL